MTQRCLEVFQRNVPAIPAPGSDKSTWTGGNSSSWETAAYPDAKVTGKIAYKVKPFIAGGNSDPVSIARSEQFVGLRQELVVMSTRAKVCSIPHIVRKVDLTRHKEIRRKYQAEA